MTTCTKHKYRTKIDAKIALSRTEFKQNRGNKKRNEVRVYRCVPCKAWHLTSEGRA